MTAARRAIVEHCRALSWSAGADGIVARWTAGRFAALRPAARLSLGGLFVASESEAWVTSPDGAVLAGSASGLDVLLRPDSVCTSVVRYRSISAETFRPFLTAR